MIQDPISRYVTLSEKKERRAFWRENIKDALIILSLFMMAIFVRHADLRDAARAEADTYEDCTARIFDVREARFENHLVILLAVLLADDVGQLPTEITESLPSPLVALVDLFQAGQEPTPEEILEACGTNPEE